MKVTFKEKRTRKLTEVKRGDIVVEDCTKGEILEFIKPLVQEMIQKYDIEQKYNDFLEKQWDGNPAKYHKYGVRIRIGKGTSRSYGYIQQYETGITKKAGFVISINIPKRDKFNLEKAYKGYAFKEFCEKKAKNFYQTFVHEFRHFYDALEQNFAHEFQQKKRSAYKERESEIVAIKAEKEHKYNEEILKNLSFWFEYNYF